MNALTSERLTDIGAGATFYSVLVEVAKLSWVHKTSFERVRLHSLLNKWKL